MFANNEALYRDIASVVTSVCLLFPSVRLPIIIISQNNCFPVYFFTVTGCLARLLLMAKELLFVLLFYGPREEEKLLHFLLFWKSSKESGMEKNIFIILEITLEIAKQIKPFSRGFMSFTTFHLIIPAAERDGRRNLFRDGLWRWWRLMMMIVKLDGRTSADCWLAVKLSSIFHSYSSDKDCGWSHHLATSIATN